jgi:hypothetical protein
MNKPKSPSRAFEVLWLAVALMTILTGIHKSVNFGISTSWYFFGFTCLAVAMFLMRRAARRKSERENADL